MRKIIVFVIVFVQSFALSFAQAEYTAADSIRVESLLKKAKDGRGNTERMYYFGKEFLGVPYVAHTLENGTKEHLIVNLRQLDCTTFVETVLALSLCDKNNRRTFKDYCSYLRQIRYRGGVMKDYTSRLHYFTWWGEDNEKMGFVKAISTNTTPFTAVQTINVSYMTDNSSLYKQLKSHPEFVPIILKYEQESNGKKYRYIPKSLTGGSKQDLSCIKTGDIVSLLTKKKGLDTTHIGIAVWGSDGKLHLMNASSLTKNGKSVVISKETLYDYLQTQPNNIGIRIYRMQ